MKNKILFIVLFLMFLPLISAKGLEVSPSTLAVSKIYNQNYNTNITIKNTENFPFYNLTFNFNDIDFKVEQIPANSQIFTPITIKSNLNLNQNLTLKGFYSAFLGASHQTYDIIVDYYAGISKCSFSIIKGDTLKFINNVADPIVMKNAQTGNDISTINQNASYLMPFDTPQTISYYFLRRGFQFTPVCTITVLDDTGVINNPEYDGSMFLNLNIIYLPTTISTSFIQTNYTIPVFTSQDGIFSVTNTGNQTARSIILGGDWFSFNSNNFDLEPGQTKGIVYTIKPVVTKTEDTDKTYNKTISISGNFLTTQQDFSIKVPYADLNGSIDDSNVDSLMALIIEYCRQNPLVSFCSNQTKTVYVYGNGSNSDFNVTYSQQQVRQIYDYIFKMGDDLQNQNSYNKESFDELRNSILNITNVVGNAMGEINNMKTEGETNTALYYYTMFAILGIGIVATLTFLILKYRKRNTLREGGKF